MYDFHLFPIKTAINFFSVVNQALFSKTVCGATELNNKTYFGCQKKLRLTFICSG